MRRIFTDKWNSFWHVVIGEFAFFFPAIIPSFLVYQLLQGTPNDFIDILEFLVGYSILVLLNLRAEANQKSL